MSGGRRITRRAGLGAAVTALGAAVAGTGWAVAGRPRAATPATPVATDTAAVTRGAVAERERFTGTLGYDGTYPVAHLGAPGVLTAVAAAGATVRRGGVLYRVADQPVRLLYGTVPAYRDLAPGVPPGPDVRQLEANLVALGMDPGRRITVDSTFTAATGAAVRRWQAALGLPARQRTGALPQGSLVFAPGALRIAQVQAVVGHPVAPGTAVLSATSTDRVVLAQVPVVRQSLIHVGDQVQVTVSGFDGAAAGRVVQVGRTATQEQNGQSQNGQQTPATITVTIRVTLPAGTADLDQAPAGVLVTTASRTDVLLVPVVALLPRTGGGYQVRLAAGGYVAVTPGLYDELTGDVEVTGDLHAGQLVQVPVQ
jgi:peptidoglycan hydrolase-like protein with peptidoglycan-binding domain